MLNKSTLLFDKNKHLKRPLPEQTRFENEYQNLLTRMPILMDMAFRSMDEERKKKSKMAINRNWAANTMNGNIIDLISKEFPHYVKDTGRGSYYLDLDNKYECYVKKLDKQLLPQYNHTDKSKELVSQIACINEEPIPVIYIGYTATKGLTVIKDYYAVCVKNGKVIWESDLTSIQPKTYERNTYENDIEPVVEVVVKQKKKAK